MQTYRKQDCCAVWIYTQYWIYLKDAGFPHFQPVSWVHFRLQPESNLNVSCLNKEEKHPYSCSNDWAVENYIFGMNSCSEVMISQCWFSYCFCCCCCLLKSQGNLWYSWRTSSNDHEFSTGSWVVVFSVIGVLMRRRMLERREWSLLAFALHNVEKLGPRKERQDNVIEEF